MTDWRERLTGRVVRRWAIVSLALAPVVAGALSLIFWLDERIHWSFYWRAGLAAAVALGIAYEVVIVVAPLGLVVLLTALAKGRPRTPGRRRCAARFTLAFASVILSLSVAEAATAVWRSLTESGRTLPPGGLTTDPREPAPLKAIADLRAATFPSEFPDPDNDREIDVVMVGESSAEGVPYNYWVSITTILGWRLGEILPGRPIRQHILAASGDTLEGQCTLIGRLDLRPDLFIIYCGQNEITARLRPGRDVPYYRDDATPTAWARLVGRVEQLSPILGLLHETAEKCRIAIPPPRYGHRQLIDSPVYTTREYRIVLEDFRARLEAVVAWATGVGAIVVLVAPASNDAGFEPNRSYLPADTPRSERDRFQRDFLAARALENGPPEPALAAFQALIDRQPTFADSHYRLARQLERTGDWALAYRHDVLARDLDGYPMRLPTEFQDVYRETARRHHAILIDAQSYFHAIGRHGLLDEHLFHDAIHPSLRGQIALAQAILAELKKRGALGWPAGVAVEPIDPAACVEHFALVPEVWRQVCLWGAMFYDLTYPVRHDPTARLAKKREFIQAAIRVEAGANPDSLGLPNIGVPEPVPLVPRVDAAARE